MCCEELNERVETVIERMPRRSALSDTQHATETAEGGGEGAPPYHHTSDVYNRQQVQIEDPRDRAACMLCTCYTLDSGYNYGTIHPIYHDQCLNEVCRCVCMWFLSLEGGETAGRKGAMEIIVHQQQLDVDGRMFV